MPDVLRIQDQCYTDIVPESAQSLRAKVEASPATCLVAETGGAVLGYLIAVPVSFPDLPALDAPSFELPAAPDTLYLHDLAVARAGRGTGAGQRLVRSVMEAANAAGLARACLVAIQGSVPYWQQFGFAPEAPPHAGIAAKLASYGPSAQLMAARLNPPA